MELLLYDFLKNKTSQYIIGKSNFFDYFFSGDIIFLVDLMA